MHSPPTNYKTIKNGGKNLQYNHVIECGRMCSIWNVCYLPREVCTICCMRHELDDLVGRAWPLSAKFIQSCVPLKKLVT